MYVMSIISDLKFMYENDKLGEYMTDLLNDYESLGPLPGILLPFIESFLPFLPLIVFVIANGAAYGLIKGFLWSWIGACTGSIMVFWAVRKLGDKRVFRVIRSNKQVAKVTKWLERHGFGALFLLMCFPFSPSSVIHVVSGLSKISFQQFILAVLFGKSLMIFSIVYIGSSIMSFAKNPVQTIIVGVGVLMFWVLGKYIERRMQRRGALDEQKEQGE